MILPKEQNLAEFYADDYAKKTMPEAYVETLARTEILTITHLLPLLQKKVKWEEQARTIILIGVRGEVPLEQEIAEGTVKRPLLDRVPKNGIILGYELHGGGRIAVGDTVALNGRSFTVAGVNRERGSKDDISAWIPLDEMQGIYGEAGRINAIMALQCKCAWGDLPIIRSEIARILPETQVIELSTQALARAEARWQGELTAQAVLAEWKANRLQVRHQLDRLLLWLQPGLLAAALVVIAVLTWMNVRARSGELGILMAMGLDAIRLSAVIVGKSLIMGGAGGILGLVLGLAFWPVFANSETSGLVELTGLSWLGWLWAVGVVVAGLGAWLPCLIAVRSDPIVLLKKGSSQ